MIRTRSLRILAVVGALFVVIFIGRLWSGGYLDRDAIWRFPATGRAASVDVLFFSGDAGMRFGAGPYLAHALAPHGIDTTAMSTSTLFRFGKDRAGLDTLVAKAVARAAERAGQRHLIVIGQSYGADILQTGLADLSAPLRARIAAVVLIVPGTTSYFRADPLGLLYYGKPDSHSVVTARRIDWSPVTCIYGVEEKDSVCPLLTMPNATAIGLPGGHYFNHDNARLAATVLQAIDRAAVAR